MSFPVKFCLGNGSSQEEVNFIELKYTLRPGSGPADIDIIIIPELITLFQDAVGIIQIKLIHCIISRKISFSKLVYVHIKIATQQVINFFIIMVALQLVGGSGSKINILSKLGIDH